MNSQYMRMVLRLLAAILMRVSHSMLHDDAAALAKEAMDLAENL